MKLIIYAAISTMLISCTSSTKQEETTANTNVKSTKNAELKSNDNALQPLISGYLNIKNALVKDDGKAAAASAADMLKSVEAMNTASMTADETTAYKKLSDDLKENVEHISTNASKIDYQREHFELLTADINDLINTFGAGRTLYRDHCPMADNGKGADWLSESKEIHNPYMGAEMPGCGEVEEELK